MALRERHTKALRKKAGRGFSGYPVATVAYYGPDDKVATNVAVGILLAEGEEPAVLERWFSSDTNVRRDYDVNQKILDLSSVRTAPRAFCWPIAFLGARTRGVSTVWRAPHAHGAHSGRTAIAGALSRCLEVEELDRRCSMSSSHRSSRTEPARSRGRCPTCGSDRVIKTEEDVVLRVGNRRHRFQQLRHERCLACGERIFDLVASQQFDVLILKRRRRAA